MTFLFLLVLPSHYHHHHRFQKEEQGRHHLSRTGCGIYAGTGPEEVDRTGKACSKQGEASLLLLQIGSQSLKQRQREVLPHEG